MQMSKELALRLFRIIDADLQKLTLEEQQLRATLRRVEEQSQELRNLRTHLFAPVCKSCNGSGKIRDWVAQDESRLVTCDPCAGTGMRKNVYED